MRRSAQVLLLVLAAVVCLGTSKRLLGKKLTNPKIKTTEGVTVVGEPQAFLKENPNNQGCFASQRVDFVLRAQLRNSSKHPLHADRSKAQLFMAVELKKESFRATNAYFQVPDAQGVTKRSATLAPGAKGTLYFRAKSILSKKAAAKVRRLRVNATLGSATLQLEYRDIQDIKLENVR